MATPALLPAPKWELPEIKATVPVIETKKTTGIFRNIWAGIKKLFTNENPPVTAEGQKVILQDKDGNPIVAKTTNVNWEAILSGVGALVGIFTQTKAQSQEESQVSPQIQNDQNVRSGKTAIILVIVGVLVLIGSLFAINKFKKMK
jgi:hypothetical protein